MTGPREKPHAVIAAACFFGILILVVVDLVQSLVGA